MRIKFVLAGELDECFPSLSTDDKVFRRSVLRLEVAYSGPGLWSSKSVDGTRVELGLPRAFQKALKVVNMPSLYNGLDISQVNLIERYADIDSRH